MLWRKEFVLYCTRKTELIVLQTEPDVLWNILLKEQGSVKRHKAIRDSIVAFVC